MKKHILLMFAMIPALSIFAQWWPEVRVTNDPYLSFTSYRKCISAIGDTVHIVWYDISVDDRTVIKYVRSMDAGLNWDTEQALTDGISFDEEPSIVASGNTVHIVWYHFSDYTSPDNQIYYRRSSDGGETWDDELPLTASSGVKWGPSITISGNYVYIVWHDESDGNWEIYFIRSDDYGITWDDPVQLTNQFDISAWATVAASGAKVHVAWHDWRDGNKEVYYKRSDDNGATWGDDTRLTFADGDSRWSKIGVSGTFVNIVWQDNRDGDYDIYSISSTDGGLTWAMEQRLTFESSSSEWVDIAVVGSESHIAWQDNRPGLNQIYYKNGHNNGTEWEEDERIVNSTSMAEYPSIAFSGEWLHIAWEDVRFGNEEIFCKSKYIENPIGIGEESPDDAGMEVSIYPNPASSQFAVRSSRSAACPEGPARRVSGHQSSYIITMADVHGRMIKEFEDVYTFPYLIDIYDLSDGIYILQFMGEDGISVSKKLLKIAE